MRCRITNPRKLRRYGLMAGEPLIAAITRGGTDHRVDVVTVSGKELSLYPTRAYREAKAMSQRIDLYLRMAPLLAELKAKTAKAGDGR